MIGMEFVVIAFSVVFIVSLFFTCYLFILYKKIQRNIKLSVSPHFLNITPTMNQFLDLISAIWILKKFVTKLIKDNELEDKARPINSNLNKLDNVLKSFGFEVIDYTGKKYNDGMNVDIVNVIKVKSDNPVILETIEPAIVFKDNLLKKAKIIREIKEGSDE